jgi:hypothetical protein
MADSPVRASAAGKVTFAGGDPCCGYGYYVVVQHAEGFSTLYGHLAELSVSADATVEQGDLLGLGGSTGASDGKHLHFEISQNDRYLDPLRFLALAQDVTARPVRAQSCPGERLVLAPASTLLLRFTSSSLDGYQMEAPTIRPLSAVLGGPEIEARSEGQKRVAVNIDALPAASGNVFEYGLSVGFTRGSERVAAECTLVLNTVASHPELNRQPTATPRPRPTLIPKRTATPVSGAGLSVTVTPGTPTRTPTITASRTPSPVPTSRLTSGTPTRIVGTPPATPTRGTTPAGAR